MSNYNMPPVTTNRNGDPRRVGIEIEFGGLIGTEAVDAIQGAVGGSVKQLSAHRFQISGTPLGDLTVELDASIAHADDPEEELEIAQAARAAFGDIVQGVVPHELVTPPIAMSEIELVDPIVDALRDAGAIGTGANPFHAFGLHLNPEAARLESDYLLSIIRAFILLNDHLRDQIRPDMTRRLLAWASPYGDDYRKMVVSPDYMPSLSALIRDYVAANSGRNFDLDLLPLFAEIDEPLMASLVGNMTSPPRPAFHYRLPDCRVDEPDWDIAADWNRWVEVERLASDPHRVLEEAQQFFTGDMAEHPLSASNDN